VVKTEIAVFADPFGVEGPFQMLTLESLLGSATSMIAILAHSIGIVLLIGMGAFGYLMSVLT
jgi:hypothetical protein